MQLDALIEENERSLPAPRPRAIRPRHADGVERIPTRDACRLRMENMGLRDSDHSGDGNKRVCTDTCAHARTDMLAIDL